MRLEELQITLFQKQEAAVRFFKIDVLKNFAVFTGKRMKRFQHRCFPVNNFLRTAFLYRIPLAAASEKTEEYCLSLYLIKSFKKNI